MKRFYTSNDGVTRCARYAFGPNRLHLCGPDANREVLAYLQAGASDVGLAHILQEFKTLFPYLKQIAEANGITDPFNSRVVEAYWIGNELLENIGLKNFWRHLAENLKLKSRINIKTFNQLTEKLPRGARMHHSFHVFCVQQKTGHAQGLHTLEGMDACRVSWGKILAVDGPKIKVLRRPLILKQNKLILAEPEEYTITRQLADDYLFDNLQPDKWLTIHWQVPCEIVNEQNIHWLEYYTLKHLNLANQTL